MSFSVVNENALREAIAQFKKDANEVDWVVANHAGAPNIIQLVGYGNGGLSQLLEKIQDDNISYAYLRVEEQVEISKTIKFVFLHFVGERVSTLQNARYATIRGLVTSDYFTPHHVSFQNISDKSEITEKAIRSKVAEASGTAAHELESITGRQERNFTGKPTSQDSPHLNRPAHTENVNKSTKASSFCFSDELINAVKEVRADTSSVQYVIAGYHNKDSKSSRLVLEKKSSGDIAEFVKAFDDASAQYGLLRTFDVYEGITTVKFVYVTWVCESMAAMARARTTVHRGACSEFFAPFHVALDAKFPSDLSEEEIRARVAKASGSKNYVI